VFPGPAPQANLRGGSGSLRSEESHGEASHNAPEHKIHGPGVGQVPAVSNYEPRGRGFSGKKESPDPKIMEITHKPREETAY
jgi:hypothetical protein